MLNPERLISDTINRYPQEYRAQLQTDLRELLRRQRSYLIGQVQMLLSCRGCSNLDNLRAEIDQLFLSDDYDPPAPPSEATDWTNPV